MKNLLPRISAEKVDVDKIGLGQLWASRVPDEGRPLVLCYNGVGSRVTRYDVVARTQLAFQQSIVNFALVRDKLSFCRFGGAR